MGELSVPVLRSPLADREADLATISAEEVAYLRQHDVRCGLEAAERLGFPLEPNTVTGDAARGVLWLGPDEWLVVSVPGTEPQLLLELEGELAGSHHSVVDVSASRAVLELRGDDRLELLGSGCGLDLDPRGGWTPGRCAQTLFGRSQMLLQELDGATRAFVRSSFAHATLDRLLAAAEALRT